MDYKYDEFAIYVSSFDGYKDLWDTFFSILDIFWKKRKCKTYLVNNEEDYSWEGVSVINTGPEVDWFKRNINALEKIDEPYILFMLEDYFISKDIDDNNLADIIEFMKKNDLFYYRLSKSKLKSKEAIIKEVWADTPYPISLQPALWNRKKMLEYLKTIDQKSPWDFENYFVNYYKGKKEIIPGICFDNRDILGYKNGVLRGKWIPSTIRFYKQQGIIIDTQNRNILKRSIAFKFELADWLSGLIPGYIKEVIKGIVRKLHIKYL